MKTIFIIIVVLLGLWIVWSFFMDSDIESPAYAVVEKADAYEIRKYESYIIAEVTVPGNISNATGRAFGELGGYIFGGNEGQTSIAMTAPVATTQTGQSIAMTSPVATRQNDEELTMSFSMPSGFTLENLPKPNSDNIVFKEVPAGTYAVSSFSGLVNESRRIRETEKLLTLLNTEGITTTGTSELLQYDRPTKFPLLRTNEIRIQIENKKPE